MRAGRVQVDVHTGTRAAAASSTTARSPRTSPRPHAIAYTASKHAITGLSKQLSLEGREFDIACGRIDIGNAASAMTSGVSAGAPQPDGSTMPEPTMDPANVADMVLHMAELTLSANVRFMTVMATKMPFTGRG